MSTSRQALLDAAQALFWAQGVGATSPREVLAASGVGQGSLYHHFPTKQDLAVAAIHETVTEALDAADAELAAPGAANARLISYLRRPRPALAGCKVGRLVSDQAVMDDERLSDEVRSYFTGLVDRVREVLADTGLPSDRAHRQALAAVATVQGGYVLARATGDPAALTGAVEGFVDLLTGPAAPDDAPEFPREGDPRP